MPTLRYCCLVSCCTDAAINCWLVIYSLNLDMRCTQRGKGRLDGITGITDLDFRIFGFKLPWQLIFGGKCVYLIVLLERIFNIGFDGVCLHLWRVCVCTCCLYCVGFLHVRTCTFMGLTCLLRTKTLCFIDDFVLLDWAFELFTLCEVHFGLCRIFKWRGYGREYSI